MTRFSFSTREKRIFILLVAAVIILIFYLAVYLPTGEKMSLLENEIRVAERQLKKDVLVIRKARQLEEQDKALLEEFRQKDTDENVMSSILSEIEAVAGEVGMRIADMKPKKARRIDFYNDFSVSLSIDGKLPDITHFMYVLQSSPHRFFVDEFSLEKRSPTSPELNCRLAISKILVP
jgi:Tfp pilus assembly protein PilO